MIPQLIVLVMTLLVLASGAAQAVVVSGTVTGKIDGHAYDTYGLFGTPGADLSGRLLTATYSYDTAPAAYSLQPGSDNWLGAGYLSLSVTIGGVTVTAPGVTESEVIDSADGADTEITLANFDPTPELDFVLFATGDWVPGVSIDAPFSLDPTYYQQTIYVSADGSHYDTLNFVGLPAPAAPIPEPACLSSFGLALAVLRGLRRSRAICPRHGGQTAGARDHRAVHGNRGRAIETTIGL
jgi:hypothetical protein